MSAQWEGLGGFKALLREFRGLSWGVLGAGVAVPFAAELASLSPPWPPAVTGLTAITELVVLVLVYQFLRASRRRVINRVLVIAAIILAVSALTYLAVNSELTYETRGPKKERLVKGFECKEAALKIFGDSCPLLGSDEISLAQWNAETLWTSRSITMARLSLVVPWLLSFLSLSMLLGSFLVFQSKQRKRTLSVTK
jgi:hypothetical protein